MKFKLIAKEDINDFNNEVTKRLNSGWKLRGSAFIDNNNYYCQAMTHKPSKNKIHDRKPFK